MNSEVNPMRRTAPALLRRASSTTDAQRRGRRRRWPIVVAVLAGVVTLAACATFETVDYYWQGAAGQIELLANSQPIPDVIGRSDGALAARLKRIHEIREFASRELGLPNNGSYTRYTDLGRPYVTWNVFATPELSLKPRQWCFPIAGCVNYRGYFREAQAAGESKRLRAAGDDVYVGGVPAYSTLGWFDDPVLSSFVSWPETEIARLIFHELAHQLIYVKSDSAFNESYATTVEEAGLARWLASRHDSQLDRLAARADHMRGVFRDLVRTTRTKLSEIYASNASDDDKRRAKLEIVAAMKAAYESAKQGDPALSGYDRWFAQQPNNAALAAVGLYTDRVPAFRELLHEANDDLPTFYQRVRELAARPKRQRDAALDALARRAAASAMTAQRSPTHAN
ncbi:MAG TPA: aminopeptidase [Casimicrobiaceae bacterium]|nr:aminopeptidase [Casimicrobiaceae bacterium]